MGAVTTDSFGQGVQAEEYLYHLLINLLNAKTCT